MRQLSLFASDARGAATPIEPIVTEEDRALAAQLRTFVRFGTSSWSFPGWAGVLWRGRPTEQDLAHRGLAAYAAHPLFRAVGLDRSYYAPLRAEHVGAYADQIAAAARAAPPRVPFRVVSKVWEEITTAVFPRHPRHGARAGERNPLFLDAERFQADVLAPFLERPSPAWGPFVFELTPMPPGAIDERTLARRVEDLLGRLPAGHRWAFELRNPELFGRRWLDMLRANGAAHVFSFWTAMPRLADQLRAGAIGAPFTVVRLMLPPYTRYATRQAELAPFDRIRDPQIEMREDVVAILRAAASAGCDEAFVLVNNKAEGSAPLTGRALARSTADAFAR
jgi:uncharacterized protein YecE (DUF72 family)